MDLEKGKTRTFICIAMPDEILKEAARVQESLGKWKFTGKMTEPENLHLTLKFLGEIEEKIIEEAREKLKEIAFERFEARLGSIGIFNYKGNPRIVWIKICGKGIFELQKNVDLMLKNLFAPEKRFMSHMTIARVKYVKDKKNFIEQASNISIRRIAFPVCKFFLMKSDLSEHGPDYAIIEDYACQNKENIKNKDI